MYLLTQEQKDLLFDDNGKFRKNIPPLPQNEIERILDDALGNTPLPAGTVGKVGNEIVEQCADQAKKKFNPQIDRASDAIRDFLGDGAILKKNKAGDPILINKDNTKRVRFDVKNPHGDKPHGHIEIKKGKRWKDYTTEHRIYLK